MKRFTLDQLSHAQQAQAMAQIHPNEIHDRNTLPDPVLERSHSDEPLEANKTEGRNPESYFVRVVSYRRRLLDEDNLAEKYHVDALRYSGLLPTDAPSRCRIETTQIKVATKAEEKTVIDIEIS